MYIVYVHIQHHNYYSIRQEYKKLIEKGEHHTHVYDCITTLQ